MFTFIRFEHLKIYRFKKARSFKDLKGKRFTKYCLGSVGSDRVEDRELDRFTGLQETQAMVKSFQIGK